MKFDIVRAWKDETYRQNLNSEELHLLPANPAGELELTDADLASISGTSGGWGPGYGSGPECGGGSVNGGGSGGSGGSYCGCTGGQQSNFESHAAICEVNVFSLNVLNVSVTHLLIGYASPTTQICASTH